MPEGQDNELKELDEKREKLKAEQINEGKVFNTTQTLILLGLIGFAIWDLSRPTPPLPSWGIYSLLLGFIILIFLNRPTYTPPWIPEPTQRKLLIRRLRQLQQDPYTMLPTQDRIFLDPQFQLKTFDGKYVQDWFCFHTINPTTKSKRKYLAHMDCEVLGRGLIEVQEWFGLFPPNPGGKNTKVVYKGSIRSESGLRRDIFQRGAP